MKSQASARKAPVEVGRRFSVTASHELNGKNAAGRTLCPHCPHIVSHDANICKVGIMTRDFVNSLSTTQVLIALAAWIVTIFIISRWISLR